MIRGRKPLEIVDVSNWLEDDTDASGSRKKQWLKSENHLYLFKEPKDRGELYAEHLAYKIGIELFDLNIPETNVAIRNGVEGILSKNFVDSDKVQFSEISDYFEKRNPEFDPENLFHYQLDSCIEIVEELNLMEDFFNMCLFDSIIANQDRHCENWGILQSSSPLAPVTLFAPLYDNSPSLGCLLRYDELEEYLKLEEKFKKYTTKARTLFSIGTNKKVKINELICYLKKIDDSLLKKNFDRFSVKSYDKIYNIVDSVDENYLCSKRKELVTQLILHRIITLETWILEKR